MTEERCCDLIRKWEAEDAGKADAKWAEKSDGCAVRYAIVRSNSLRLHRRARKQSDRALGYVRRGQRLLWIRPGAGDDLER